VAPNRIFNVEWRAVIYASGAAVNFEVRLVRESRPEHCRPGLRPAIRQRTSATVGVQKDTGSQYTQFECNTGGLNPGLLLAFSQPPCGTPPPVTATPPPPTADAAADGDRGADRHAHSNILPDRHGDGHRHALRHCLLRRAAK